VGCDPNSDTAASPGRSVRERIAHEILGSPPITLLSTRTVGMHAFSQACAILRTRSVFGGLDPDGSSHPATTWPRIDAQSSGCFINGGERGIRTPDTR
jgi:hypothetical protein